MKLGKICLSILCLSVCFLSCKKDDDGDDTVTVEIRDRAEQQIEDNNSIIEYLETHYYNKSAFEGNTNPKISELQIKSTEGLTISEDADSLLINAVGVSKKTVYADTDYEFYVLKLNQGGGEDSPTFSDNVLVNYEGFTLDNEVFDSAVTPVEFDLINLVPGWRKVLPDFNVAESYVENNDGTVDFVNSGVGVMFLPSGLGYFSSATSSISSYSPIAFKFELIHTTENDHDGDGVPSYLEDLNGDGEFTLANEDEGEDPTTDDDTDDDLIPDYYDTDDDGDGIPTIYEDIDEDGDPTNDIGKNGIPKYLDPEETESNT
ncbi:FKBP-type peptidyl-prolyl cis-trans isomerase [Seonamhaeicola sp.]|uniref:FKBP-type peptidyl-prolyl cis-trans isomerase n=1 Tax=Seonamhaeicola sp. TaxID=1912245 RepID=UPI0035655334